MNSRVLVETVKEELRRQGIPYRILADMIGLSEAAVKRLFSEENFSLRRLDQICAALHIDLGDLVRRATPRNGSLHTFPDGVEEELARRPQLLLAWYFIVMGHSAPAVRRLLKIEKPELHRLARQLEGLGILEVLPGEKYQTKFPKSVRWVPGGALSRRYGPAIRDEFFACDFTGEQEYQDFLTGMLTHESFLVIKRKIAELFQQFDQLSKLDSQSTDPKSEVYWCYTGIRPWAPIEVIQRKSAKV